MKYEITQLRNSFCVRPEGMLGTCGWIDGKPWQAEFFSSMAKAQQWINQQ